MNRRPVLIFATTLAAFEIAGLAARASGPEPTPTPGGARLLYEETSRGTEKGMEMVHYVLRAEGAPVDHRYAVYGRRMDGSSEEVTRDVRIADSGRLIGFGFSPLPRSDAPAPSTIPSCAGSPSSSGSSRPPRSGSGSTRTPPSTGCAGTSSPGWRGSGTGATPASPRAARSGAAPRRPPTPRASRRCASGRGRGSTGSATSTTASRSRGTRPAAPSRRRPAR